MREVNLRSLDLNLLVALRALFDERHVSRAAEKAGMSQPGMSRALQRLREVFRDPLLVKSGNGYELTPRADTIDLPLRQVLADVQSIFSAPSFDPSAAQGEIRLAAFDYVVLLPTIITRLREQAPGLTLKAVTFDALDLNPLIKGELHLAFTSFELTHSGLYRQWLCDEESVCLVSSRHISLQKPLSLVKLMQLDHITINLTGFDPCQVDHTLATMGLTRNIVATVPTFLLAAHTVANSDLIAILPRRIGLQLLKNYSVSILELPINFPKFKIYQTWHERYNKDPQHTWLRKLIADIAQTLK